MGQASPLLAGFRRVQGSLGRGGVTEKHSDFNAWAHSTSVC